MKMLFKKYAKMAVNTIPFTNSLLYLVYFPEIVLEYDISTLMNEN